MTRNDDSPTPTGPLSGLRILEIAGLGAGPFCGMVLSDLGAEVIRVGRPAEVATGSALTALLGIPDASPAVNVMDRGRRPVAVNLKHPEGRELLLGLVEDADAIFEGFRPGVMERLGLGPDACMERNPRIVYGRMTGWGQEGPYAHAAGHDINYIALAGVLHSFGMRGGPPVPPLNVVGDFGGGGLLLAVGILAALLEARSSGQGQVVDAAMVDGSALLMTMMHGLRAAGAWVDERGSNFNDTGAHFYTVYETADNRYLTIGAMEPQFYAELVELLGLEMAVADQWEPGGWESKQQTLAEIFQQRTLAEWSDLLEGTDACFAPVLSMAEAPAHPHNVHRKVFVEVDGVVQPAPAPRFSRTASSVPPAPVPPGARTREVLQELGIDSGRLDELRDLGVIAWPGTEDHPTVDSDRG
jgi:alpha-methylacyl-CoA racemase